MAKDTVDNAPREDAPRILWVEGSPKGERSLSTACANAFLAGVRHDSPGASVEHLDVWSEDLPEFGGDAAHAKFAPLFGEETTPEQDRIWAEVLGAIERLRSADLVVVSAPMWNWSIPYRLKHWLDIVVQPLISFTVNDQGEHVGVIGVGKQAQLILTRSSAYDGRSPEMVDHQQSYLEYLFGGMLGYALHPSFVVEPTTRWTAPEREALRNDAVADAEAAGRRFSFTERV
ncbi:MAG: NAD(P)H-dependent oxidoreductase [Microthrixaceae bacterium]